MKLDHAVCKNGSFRLLFPSRYLCRLKADNRHTLGICSPPFRICVSVSLQGGAKRILLNLDILLIFAPIGAIFFHHMEGIPEGHATTRHEALTRLRSRQVLLE